MLNKKWTIAAVAGVTIAAAAGAAGLAAADTDPNSTDPGSKATEYVDGFEAVEDDWNDHAKELGGSLCEDCENSSGTDIVMLWQSVLVTDGELSDGSNVDVEIDGEFGSETAEATAQWQEANDLDPTGEVDDATWAAAGQKLEPDDEGGVQYRGFQDNYSLEFARTDDADGAYALTGLTAAGEQWVNEGGDTIELFDKTIDLKEEL